MNWINKKKKINKYIQMIDKLNTIKKKIINNVININNLKKLF